MIFGMLDFNFSFMDFTIFDDFFTEYVFSWGSRTSAPSWRARRHGLRNAIFLLTGLLMRFQPNCMAWTFEYVATYANACSLLQPCEPLCWSWTCRPAVLGEEKASCAMRQTHAVHFSSGELLLLSHSCAWNGVYASYLTHKLVVCALLSGPVEGIAALWTDSFRWRGDYCPTSVSARPGPKSGSHQLFVCTASRLSDAPTGGGPINGSSPFASHGGKRRVTRIPTGQLHRIAT